MAHKLVTLCDPHMVEHDAEEPGSPYRMGVQLPGQSWQWVDIDLCTADAAALHELTSWLEKYGRPGPAPDGSSPGARGPRGPYKTRKKDGPAPDGRPFACPACDYAATNKSALRSHAKAKHGKRLGELEAEQTGATPTAYVCDICGGDFGRAQGLGIHKSKIHGIPGQR